MHATPNPKLTGKLTGYYFCAVWKLKEGQQEPEEKQKPDWHDVYQLRPDVGTDPKSELVWDTRHLTSELYILPMHELPSCPGELVRTSEERAFRRGWYIRSQGEDGSLEAREKALEDFRDLVARERLGEVPVRDITDFVKTMPGMAE